MTRSQSLPHLLHEVMRLSAAHPLDRKLLVCQTPAQGRELLRALAAAGTPWIGWEVTSLRSLATELIALELARTGARVADEFDLLALTDAAIDRCILRGAAGPFGAATEGAYRDAIRHSLEQLRMGGIAPDDIHRACAGAEPKLAAIAEILADYETLLAESRMLDRAAVLARAAAAVESGAAAIPDARLYLLPGQAARGVAAALVRALMGDAGAEVVASDAVLGLPVPDGLLWPAAEEQGIGPLSPLHQRPDVTGRAPADASLVGAEPPTHAQIEAFATDPPEQLPLAAPPPPPTLELFAAATPMDELREVLRRVVSRGIPWDQVEIVATDSEVYGATLDGMARRLELPVTYAGGLDASRTRVGRAVGRYLRWIADGFQAGVLREMLEAGDLAPPRESDLSGAALARRLRRLRVGWGYDRYLPAIDQALSALDEPGSATSREGEIEEVLVARERERGELHALRALLEPILTATAPLPNRGAAAELRVSPAAIARGVLAFLDSVPSPDAGEGATRKLMRDRLSRVAAALTRETSGDGAIAIVRAQVATRVAPAAGEGLATWTSAPGRLHLSDLTTGGLAARPHTFVVGLDSGRAGSVAIDPLLTDADRELLNGALGASAAPLPSSAERLAEKRFRLAAVLARLRGEITLSYSAWDATEGRAVAPAQELLQAHRLRSGVPTANYRDLREAMGPLASAVPAEGRALDDADLWLAALADGRLLLRGETVVRSVYGALDRGLRAAAERAGPTVTAYHGRVMLLPPVDPAGSRPVFSASRLETLGTCPRRFFYQYVLGVTPLRDPEWDPDVWLDAMERGSLLHAVFERALRETREAGIEYETEDFELAALRVLELEVQRTRGSTPPPSRAVFEAELVDLREDVLAWVYMIRRDGPEWLEVELKFGPESTPVEIPVGGESIAIRGSIDRVDRVAGGGVKIVDYKTGKSKRYLWNEPFSGGRRIQHVIYSLAAERLLDVEVEGMEYHFPARRGHGTIVRYDRARLARGREVLETLFEIASGGVFVATEDRHDCTFCEFADACRARVDEHRKVTSAVADWAKDVGAALPEYALLLALRASDD